MKLLFRNVHALVKNRKPFKDFIWLCQLDEQKGVDVGETYRNDKQAVTFAHFIAECERRKLVEEINRANCLAIICDGCTDTGVQEEEIVYLRMCCAGQHKTFFMGIDSPERANADGILGVITGIVEEAGITNWKKKLVAFASDGASVKMGKKGGVVAKLKSEQPSLQAVHCFAHRLELAFKDAMKKSPYYPRMNTLLFGLYLFYHNSPLNRQNLKKVFESLEVDPLIPTRVGGTRWLPHTERALVNFWEGYSAIKTHLEQLPTQKGASADMQGKAKGFLRIMRDPSVLKFMLFMTDVITLLGKLSVLFQDTNATVTDVRHKLESTCSVLEKYKSRDGPRLRQLESISSMTGVDFSNATIQTCRATVISSLVDCIQTRFSDTNDGVIAACNIADFRSWPQEESDSEDFGEDDVATLVQHYREVLKTAGVDVDNVEVEWDLLKTSIYKRYKDISVLTWPVINKTFDNCPNILSLIDLVLTIPAHSADAERGFSEMKMVKTDWRSGLRPSVLSDLLFIQFHTEDIPQYDPTDAVNLWHAAGSRARRPCLEPYGPRPVPDSSDTVDIWDEMDPDYMDIDVDCTYSKLCD